jgi:hypothetical protein
MLSLTLPISIEKKNLYSSVVNQDICVIIRGVRDRLELNTNLVLINIKA